MLDYYHSLYDEDHKTFLKSKVENFAVWQDFVTEFTSLVVVESEISRNRRGLQMIHKRLPNLNVQIKKKRSQEKKDQLAQYFSKSPSNNLPLSMPNKMPNRNLMLNSDLMKLPNP